jgi:neutral ceramidase
VTVLMIGVAVEDITPPPGLAMAGFGARTAPAKGAHDPLTVRAIAVGETVLAVADVIGLHEDLCARVRRAAPLPDAHVALTATHTHGGPATMPGRIGKGYDPAYGARLEAACLRAVERALAARAPAILEFGVGADPGVAKNRRHAGGIVDPSLPVLLFRALDGAPKAILAAYACHPVVLGPDNLLWTADYPGFVRRELEAAHPGAIAIFATGCCGDANTGHSAQASLTTQAMPMRTFEAAAGYAHRIAASALAAPLERLDAVVAPQARERFVNLDLCREAKPPDALAARWRAERETADPVRAHLLDIWIAWAEGAAKTPLSPWRARVSCLDWAGLRIIAMPGEIFAETGLSIRTGLGGPCMALAYGEGCPGYIAPASEWPHGGYEVLEAHRYYNMPGPFAPGAAEALVRAALG